MSQNDAINNAYLVYTLRPKQQLHRTFVSGLAEAAAETPKKVVIIWEADEIGEGREFTYKELLKETCRVANGMKHAGVRLGDTVAIYMPMIPEIACHVGLYPYRSVVFAGFSADAVRDRIIDAKTKRVFTSGEGKRGGRTLLLRQIVDVAVRGLDFVRNVFIFKRTHNVDVMLNLKIDIDMDEEMPRHRPYCPAELMNSEDLITNRIVGS
ncbi:hypothetical protein PsorP6_015377 [Peronosclerospora sorghi]|uniref:Uncharacterized protein n=1 Tax=Peronosclerospora sorghi TaxID=230839 RepID=A0ACC0WML5_9STRA|nr:hypothetical protein PsorP6_015377 [Peronosclerospora sorghi]